MSITLAHQRTGSGPPLVILHGLFGSGRNWQGLARKLGETHEVLLLDLPNHGDSPHGVAMDYASMAEAVWHTLDNLGIARTRLLGHSLGGKVAMSCAAQRPEDLELLIIEDIAPVAYQDRLTPTVQTLQALDLDTLQSRAEADLKLAEGLGNATLRAFLLHGLAGTAGSWHWRFDLQQIALSLPEICKAPLLPQAPLELPTTVIMGELSRYVEAEGIAAYTRHFRDLRLVRIPDSGHWPHAEATSVFLAELGQALARPGTGRG